MSTWQGEQAHWPNRLLWRPSVHDTTASTTWRNAKHC